MSSIWIQEFFSSILISRTPDPTPIKSAPNSIKMIIFMRELDASV